MQPRELTPEEVAILQLLLPEGGFPDVDVYREQVDHLMGTGKCACGCPTISLAVDRSRARPADCRGTPLLPVEAEAGDPKLPVQLILFAPDGWLTSLELVYFDGRPPAHFPPLSDLRIRPRPADHNVSS